MRRLRRRLSASTCDREGGFTLIELLVAAAMSVVIVGAAGSMLISAVQTQPKLSKRAQNITTARWVLERMTREIRNGVKVEEGTGSSVTFLTRVRRTACGGGVEEEADKPARVCRVTYACTTTSTTTSCSRTETAPEVESGGTPTTIVSGLGSSDVFEYDPPNPEEATYVGITLNILNPEGDGDLTVTDGASLRTLTLSQ
ncbi:MAG: prepilin-type N-terminal cleavage/methylation domain-containing protein [Solirubrobacterales bacterium]